MDCPNNRAEDLRTMNHHCLQCKDFAILNAHTLLIFKLNYHYQEFNFKHNLIQFLYILMIRCISNIIDSITYISLERKVGENVIKFYKNLFKNFSIFGQNIIISSKFIQYLLII